MKLTPLATRPTTASPGPGSGSSRSPTVSTSGPPNFSTITARITIRFWPLPHGHVQVVRALRARDEAAELTVRVRERVVRTSERRFQHRAHDEEVVSDRQYPFAGADQ